jgi:hypothetical protein
MSQASLRTGYRGASGRAGGLPGRFAGHSVILALGLSVLALLVLALLVLALLSSSAPRATPDTMAPPTAEVMQSPQPPASPAEQELLDAHARLPLSFVPNSGQADDTVRYYAQGAGYGFYFTPGGPILSFTEGERGAALALDFLGADPDATPVAREQLPGKVNYLIGDDPADWQGGLPTYGELVYGGVWPGVDMVVRGEGGKLKYEFHVQPGAAVEDIRLAYRGAAGLSLDAGGGLLVETPLGPLRDSAPVSYQVIDGERVPVESRFALDGASGYGFEVGEGYDPARPLVIDPALDYSTLLGGSGRSYGYGVAVGPGGEAYVTGTVRSVDFPTTPGAFDSTLEGSADVFVTKLDADGSSLAYSTLLGGGTDDRGHGIAVDPEGAAYVTGLADSAGYPTTPGAFDTTFGGGGGDAFVTKLDADGSSLAYSTLLGGAGYDRGNGIVLGAGGEAYLTGDTGSSNFPTTPGAFDTTFNGDVGENDVFVAKLGVAGSSLAYSTLLGGRGYERGNSIALDQGVAYVTGDTTSKDFPTTSGAYDTTPNGRFWENVFVAKLDASGSSLAYSTYLGGRNSDLGLGIAVDPGGAAYVTGNTSSRDFPTTRRAFDTSYGGKTDAFVTGLGADGSSLRYSTLLGGRRIDEGNGIAVDAEGAAYVTGWATSPNFPVTRRAYDTTLGGGGDAFVSRLGPNGSALTYSTFVGGREEHDVGWGIALGQGGRAYVTGWTASSNFPTTRRAYDTTYDSGFDAFVTKVATPAGAR